MEPRRGAIARCSRGMLGLITDDDMRTVSYPDDSTGEAYVGVHLTAPVGMQWSSRHPMVLGYVDERVVEVIIAQVAEWINFEWIS